MLINTKSHIPLDQEAYMISEILYYSLYSAKSNPNGQIIVEKTSKIDTEKKYIMEWQIAETCKDKEY